MKTKPENYMQSYKRLISFQLGSSVSLHITTVLLMMQMWFKQVPVSRILGTLLCIVLEFIMLLACQVFCLHNYRYLIENRLCEPSVAKRNIIYITTFIIVLISIVTEVFFWIWYLT